MSAFLSKLLALFMSKIAKMRYLHYAGKFQLRKLGCALNWCENAIAELRCASEIKNIKLRILRCAFAG